MTRSYRDIILTIQKPIPLDRELVWDKSKVIISETDIFGRITDVNDAFCEVNGYSSVEVIGQPHCVVRHPDMPMLIFKMLWNNLSQGINFVGVIKNLTKSGEYYWAITDFEVRRDMFGNVVNYIARRKSISKRLINGRVSPLYDTLLKLEKIGGTELSARFFKNYLDKEGKDYVDFVVDMMTENKEDVIFEETLVALMIVGQGFSEGVYAFDDEVNEKRKSFLSRLFS